MRDCFMCDKPIKTGYVCADCQTAHAGSVFRTYCKNCLATHEFIPDGFSTRGAYYKCKTTGNRLEVID